MVQTCAGPRVAKVESGGEDAEWESADAERHVKAFAEPEAWEAARAFGLRALTRRPRGHLHNAHISYILENCIRATVTDKYVFLCRYFAHLSARSMPAETVTNAFGYR